MERSVKRLVDHLIKHQFMSPSLNKFGLLGQLLQCNLRNEWFQKNVITNNTTLFLDNYLPPQSVNVDLLYHLSHARLLFGFDSSITFASCNAENSESTIASGTENEAIKDILKTMSHTFLNLHVFSVPAHKMDNFSLLQKKRRHWWKSLMKQPEMLVIRNVATAEPGVEQRLEIVSKALEGNPLEVITLWKANVYEDLQLDESLRVSTMVKFQKSSHWPCLITSRLTLEMAVGMFLVDSLTMRNKTHCLSLHHSLAPFKVAIMIVGQPKKTSELQELRQLLTQQLHQGGISVLPPSAPWTVAQCDGRAVPFVIQLDESTLENGVCGLRNRDTSLTVQIHVSEVIEKLKSVYRSV